MISIETIKNFYPAEMRGNAEYLKHILKEYVQLLVLDYLSTTSYARKITFIGGTNLRLVKGVDRFSEDLDFDCKSFSSEEFRSMSEDVLIFLQRSGFRVEFREKDNSRLKAYRSSIYFPELLFDLGLTAHKEARFMLKLEAQDQGIDYAREMVFIKGCNFFFSFPVPSDGVLCSMKISAMLARGKGRDYYDTMYLLSMTKPDYSFLTASSGIRNLAELKLAVDATLKSVNLREKQKDFEHLLFHHENSRKILNFREFINSL